ncbi:NUDIX domain-containing protein [Candidatus Woesearchaeota archaeon]|nr:NUDIX domain-containing protein [Candidatus Woesearchaeota archaeon]
MIELSGCSIIEKGRILLVKKKKENHYELPGGKVIGREKIKDTAARELKEELGIKAARLDYFGSFDFSLNERMFRSHIFLAEIDSNQEPRILEPEFFSEMLWLPIRDHKQFRLSPNVEQFLVKYLEGMKKKCDSILQNLTNKKHILFTDRGNSSIWLALKLMKKLGKSNILMPDQGGWFTYRDFSKRLKLNIITYKTDYGLVKIENLSLDANSAIFVNSLAGYFVEIQNISEIQELCRKKDAVLINDVSGSIGSELAKDGDIVLGSFGEGKPINVEYGGFIATDNKEFYDFFSGKLNKKLKEFYQELYEKLINLGKRREFFSSLNKKIKEDLKEYNIVHRAIPGINVVIRFSNEKEKEELIGYCKKNNFEYRLCPRYNRIKEDAVSIEVKRL